MAVAHGVWKCSEPLFDQVQWLGIANYDTLGSSEQGIGVPGTQQRLLRALPHGLPTETSRWGTHCGVLMAVGHGVWKCSEPLFGQVQWLSIAKHVPLGSSEQGIDVSGSQQRLLHALPHGLPTETSRQGTRGEPSVRPALTFNQGANRFEISVKVVTRGLILSGEHVETIRMVLAAREVPAPGVMTRQLR